MAGRKSKYTPDVLDKLVNVLSGGATVRDACAYVGISEDTLANWCKKNADFSESINRARSTGKIECVALVRQAARSNWQAAAWFLERSDPINWGRRDILITLGLEGQQLKELKAKADAAGVDLASVFEELINQFATVDHTGTGTE